MLLFFVAVMAHAQNITVHGTVLSRTDDEPLIGASILCDANKAGAATDIDGNFEITVPDGATLKISYVGFNPAEVKAATQLTVYLDENSELLDEVVVVGYQTVRKADLTGAVSVVSTKALQTAPDTDPMRAPGKGARHDHHRQRFAERHGHGTHPRHRLVQCLAGPSVRH